MSNDSFHYFMQLPLELRRLIWEHCLPYRIAEEDIPAFLLDGDESRQGCFPKRTTHLNTRLPVIAFVNKSIWVQPRRDVLHINWTRMSYDVMGPLIELTSPIAYFLCYEAAELGMQPSIVAEVIHYFDLKGLLDGTADDDDDDDDGIFCLRSSRHAGMCHPLQNEEASDIADLADFAPRLDVAMVAVSLHITREVALRSGLFGLLGDAPVQMVDVDDEARLRKFQALFREHALEKEPALQILFELLTSTRFRAAVEKWKRHAEWIFLASLWDYARKVNLDILGVDPGSAWVPCLPQSRSIDLHRYSPNENHPWVKEARQSLPKLRPRIMVRYCTGECYRYPPPITEW
ncbi:hypothetical protein ANOM_003349 [Aspergillus nomiae NRRL 13137]|uniref:2EXR domain-containing protein n=1 Tax=Aspergillus nomiae NRRL (strain ATCC 15546 / NRRL 13137 / CBS 260.88 / M93) TaxID=1509407 RepID=A0A0L1J8Z0_ASPN3|nr:uncharacterized protein ANOM_003349 [Aspergillus nomiae NRRL 13137]KNG88160.1 hypothetical protein ANOM_003349 [Aspergillus nomiae NRRL 13137]